MIFSRHVFLQIMDYYYYYYYYYSLLYSLQLYFFLFYYYLVFSDRILDGNNYCQGGMSDILNIMVSFEVSIVYDWSY